VKPLSLILSGAAPARFAALLVVADEVFLGESSLTFQLDAQIDSFGYHLFEDMFLIVSTCC
jgi:hypothetical protein